MIRFVFSGGIDIASDSDAMIDFLLSSFLVESYSWWYFVLGL